MLDFLGPDPSQTWEKSTNATLSTLSGNIDGIMDRVVCNQPITGGVIPEIENVANLTGNADDSLILGKSAITSQRREDLGLESYKSTSSIDALTGETLSNSNDSNLPISQIVEEAVRSAHRYLSGLASDPDFNAKMNLAFGDSWNADVASNLVQKFALGDFSEIPVIEILPSAAINGANGAFAKLTNTIYLAKEFVQENAGNLGAITSVVLEETGHFIDSKVNVSDAAGDEGDIFARVVEGKELSAGELLDLKAEDDSTVLTLNGQVFWIEQSANKKADFNGDGRTDFIRQEKGAWDDDDINTANVYISNENGTFSKQDLTDWRVMKGDGGVNIILGDFNGDKKTDFIRQEKGAWDDDDISTANVYISNGNGTFWKQDLTDWRVMKGDFTNLIVGDFNGDGKDDFIRQEKGAWDDDDISTANVYISNGNGTFWKQDLTDWRVMKGDFTNLIVGDFNGDRRTDFIRQEKGDWDNDDIRTAELYISNSNGTFSKRDLPNADSLKGDFTNIIVGDFTGEGTDDFIRQEKGDWDNDNITTAELFISNNGFFTKSNLTNEPDVMKGDFTNLILGDFNGDRKADFIRQEKGDWDNDDIRTAELYINQSNRTFWKQDLTDWRVMKGDDGVNIIISNVVPNNTSTTSVQPQISSLNPLFSNPTESNPLRGFRHPLGWGEGTPINWTHSALYGQKYAVDLGGSGNFGTSVYAMRSGTVVNWRDTTQDRNTNLLSIDDGQQGTTANFLVVKLDDNDGVDDGYRTMYLHLQQGSIPAKLKQVGARVEAGEPIGKIGYNGVSQGVHLHVEVNQLLGNIWNRKTLPFQWK